MATASRIPGFPLLAVLLVVGCAQSPAQQPAGPPVEKPKVESDLSKTTLPAAAFRSLGIRCEPARVEPVREHARLTGWVMVRPGDEVTVTAPVAGYVREATPAGKTRVPIPGLPIEQGTVLLSLEPVLSPVEQLQLATLKRGVENELAKAQESITAAESELQRVEGLHRQGLRGQQDVEQAQVRLKHAQADLHAARDKLKLFALPVNGSEARLPTLALTAPLTGTVLSVQANPGQYVPAATPLVTIADLRELWLRVPVPESILPRVDRTAAATLDHTGKPGLAEPVAAVPQVDLARHTADLLYRLPASAPANLAKDQMLSVRVPLGEARKESVVPYDAVVYDAYAGAWVYIDQTPPRAAEHVFERRRVELGPTMADGVVIRPALRPEERVVVRGAAALFSREFHKPPVTPGGPKGKVDDDDD